MKHVLVLLLSGVLGFSIGLVPGLQNHLHWNLNMIIPISGMFFGLLLGSIQFAIGYQIHLRFAKSSIFVCCLAAALTYASLDLAIWSSGVVHVRSTDGIEASYRLAHLETFRHYMERRLSSTDISHGSSGRVSLHYDKLGTVINYTADLVGALLGCLGMLALLKSAYPFCSHCARYKRGAQTFAIQYSHSEETTSRVFDEIRKAIASASYAEVVKTLNRLRTEFPAGRRNRGDFKIRAHQRVCGHCKETTILGSAQRRVGNNWKALDALGFIFTSKPGEGTDFSTVNA